MPRKRLKPKFSHEFSLWHTTFRSPSPQFTHTRSCNRDAVYSLADLYSSPDSWQLHGQWSAVARSPSLGLLWSVSLWSFCVVSCMCAPSAVTWLAGMPLVHNVELLNLTLNRQRNQYELHRLAGSTRRSLQAQISITKIAHSVDARVNPHNVILRIEELIVLSRLEKLTCNEKLTGRGATVLKQY